MKKWFYSDHHFGHTNVIKYSNRPYKNVNEMNKDFITRWNSSISPEDIVYYLGDFSFLNIENSRDILSQLNGYKILIKGNHDRKKEQMLKMGFNEVYDRLWITIDNKKVLLCHYPFVNMELNYIAEKRPNILNISKNIKEENLPIEDEIDRARNDYSYGISFLKKYHNVPINRNTDTSKKVFNFMKKIISRYIGTRPMNKGFFLIHGHSHSKIKRNLNAINVSVEAWNYNPVSEAQIISEMNSGYSEIWTEEFNITESNFKEISNKISLIKELIIATEHIPNNDRINDLNKKDMLLKTYFDLSHFEESQDIFYKYLQKIPKSAEREFFDLNKKLGRYIPKEELKVNTFYIGRCRNSSLAFWNGVKFIYLRNKFNTFFLEEIYCPEDGLTFDVFIPHSLDIDKDSPSYKKLKEYLDAR